MFRWIGRLVMAVVAAAIMWVLGSLLTGVLVGLLESTGVPIGAFDPEFAAFVSSLLFGSYGFFRVIFR